MLPYIVPYIYHTRYHICVIDATIYVTYGSICVIHNIYVTHMGHICDILDTYVSDIYIYHFIWMKEISVVEIYFKLIQVN